MNKLIFAARTREALKSYAQLNNLNPNNYVLVEVPDAIRQNKVVKSLAQNITNPDVRYVMIHKSCVTVNRNGVPSLNVTALSENSYASTLNKPDTEQIGDKTVGQGGTLKSIVSDIYNSNLTKKGKMAALKSLKSFVNQRKQEAFNNILKSAVADVERSNLGKNEKLAIFKSLSSYVAPFTPKTVTLETALKSILSDVNQSNLPLQIKNILFNVVQKGMDYSSRSQAIPEADQVVTRKNVPTKKNMGTMDTTTTLSANSEMEEEKSAKSKKTVQKSLFAQRDLVEENRALLKSLGSLSEEEGLFNNMHMARRYARLFNEKIASPSQRAEVASPSVKDVQRYGKRVKARVNLV